MFTTEITIKSLSYFLGKGDNIWNVEKWNKSDNVS